MKSFLIGILITVALMVTHAYAFDWGHRVKYLEVKEDCMNFKAVMINDKRYVCIPVKTVKPKKRAKKQKLPYTQEF